MLEAIALLESAFRLSTPLLLAALGGMLSERAGVVQISLEGQILVGGFFAAAVTSLTGSPILGISAGCMASVGFSLLYGTSVLKLGSDQIVAGTAINLLAIGMTPILCNFMFGSTASSPSLPLESRLGTSFVFVSWALVGLVYWIMAHSKLGLRIHFAGEHPAALLASGSGLERWKWTALTLCGVFCGLAGASLTMYLASSFSRNISAGRGFIALAAVILGKWKPIPTAIACLGLGLIDALQISLQGSTLFGITIPVQWVQCVPYLVTLLILGGFLGRSRSPKALGT